MAKNTGRGTRGAVSQSDAQPHPDDNGSGALWKRNLVTGRFTKSKRSGGAFKSGRARAS